MELQPWGLLNSGNTCYMNTLLQCFLRCHRLREFFLKSRGAAGGPLLQAWKVLFTEICKPNPKGQGVLHPRTFIDTLQTVCGSSMNISEQNDIHEFFMCVLDKCVRESQTTYVRPKSLPAFVPNASQAMADAYNSLKKKCEKAWSLSMQKEFSPLIDTMCGQAVVQIVCGHCQHIHHNYEVFNNLEVPLPLQGNERVNLIQCMESWFAAETLNQDAASDKWVCSECKASAPSQKITKIWKLPPVLVITLKRFAFHPQWQRFIKVRTQVAVPNQLDMSCMSMVHDDPWTVTYQLNAVAVHSGDVHFGHYHAVVRSADQWHIINDQAVHLVESSSMLNSHISEGYMLFYEVATA